MIKEISFLDISFLGFLESKNAFVKYLGYYIDGDIAGYIEYNDIYNTVDIVNVFVIEKYRRRGIARALMKKIISLDKKNITLEVSVLNKAAISLYEGLGFKRVALRKGYYNGVDAILMELIL